MILTSQTIALGVPYLFQESRREYQIFARKLHSPNAMFEPIVGQNLGYEENLIKVILNPDTYLLYRLPGAFNMHDSGINYGGLVAKFEMIIAEDADQNPSVQIIMLTEDGRKIKTRGEQKQEKQEEILTVQTSSEETLD